MPRLLTALLAIAPVFAQKNLSGVAEIKKSLDRLNTVGSVMMIAAHPDDENTALIAYFARGRNVRTGYLSLTRGEGGQNLIGAEQGDKIGVIRTQELLAARRVDGGEQMFTRMVDFGFSKTAAETIEKWDRERVLADIVWNIRRFQPDVIVLRFSGTPRDGHGHHQTSALLGKEAFAAAADPSRFPEQLSSVKPWRAKRLFWNLFNWRPGMDAENDQRKDVLVFDAGTFDPILGYSYSEIAGISRSQHRSQGMGSPERKGASRNHLELLAGDPAKEDALEGVDLTWNRVPGGEAIGQLLAKARAEFRDHHPEAILPILAEARVRMSANPDPWAKRKLADLDETIAMCAGLWVDASAERPEIVPGSKIKITLRAIARLSAPVELLQPAQKLETNQLAEIPLDWDVPADQPLSQPYWLREPKDGPRYRIPDPQLLGLPEDPAIKTIRVRARVGTAEIELERAVRHRYIDTTDGELVRPIAIVPAVAVSLSEQVLLFPSASARTVEVTLTAKTAKASGNVKLELPSGWTAEPASIPFSMADTNEQLSVKFSVKPSPGAGKGELRAVAEMTGRRYDRGIDVIRYPHIPPQTLFPIAVAELAPVDVKILSKRVGYVMGAGDNVPQSLQELGASVTLLSADDIARSDLSQYDAIVTGIRAFNTRPELRANHQRLTDYVAQGGTLITQYNISSDRFWGGNQAVNNKLGPYPFTTGAGRVTDEEAAVEILKPDPVLSAPNQITAEDWKGWVQERGLYFASEWDPRYQPLFRMKDPDEKPLDGSTLIARHGKGVYIFTALSWFRQLPAGVPGAYRIFANFLSASKVSQ
jgi:LmbE family N-acetylglucosaminyl deacetylase